MVHKQEYMFSRFELEVKQKFGLNKTELDNLDLFTLRVWLRDDLNNNIERIKKENFERLKRNGNSRN